MELVKILIVDDEESNLSLLEYVLIRNNYFIEKAKNGLIALEKFVSTDYDLVLMDVMMPVMDGIETCVKMNELNKSRPIILITALNDEETLKRGFEAGAWDYIIKPWNETELISRVHKALKLYNAEKEIRSLYEALKQENEKQVREMKLAVEVQNYFLPKWIIINNHVKLCSTYVPSEQLGGDIYDFMPLPNNRYLVYIGDISGHGVQAALMMTAVKAIIKMLVDEDPEDIFLPELISKLNKMLAKNVFYNKFLTLLIGIVDYNSFTFNYYNAGHPPFLIYDKTTGKIEKSPDKGSFPIGWNEKLNYQDNLANTIPLDYHKVFLFYTDGVIECPDASHSSLRTDGFIEMLENEITYTNELMLPYQIKHQLKSRGFHTNYDDVTILSLSLKNGLTDSQMIKYFIMNTEFNPIDEIILRVQEIVQEWLHSESLQIYIENVIRGIYYYLIYLLKTPLSDALVLIEMNRNTQVFIMSFLYKAPEPCQNESELQIKLKELIKDPLFTGSTRILINCFDDMHCLKLELFYN